MLETTRQIIQKHNLIHPGSTIIVGISGGADSLALLHILFRLSSRMDFKIHAATLDHSLRGEESAADVRFVLETCQQWGIPVTSEQVSVPQLARDSRMSMEATARMARYDFLASVARDVGAERIAVAHHANDQAETVLLRLLRGTGTHGLRGMSWISLVPGNSDRTLIRPFLQITRAEIETYCRENDLPPRQDSSNQDTHILRNALRLDLLPKLEKLNPRIQQVLTQLADIASVEDDYLEHQLEQVTLSDAVTQTERRVTIRRDAFRNLHSALQRRFIRWAAEQLDMAEYVDYVHVLDAVSLGLNGRQGAVALFEGGLQLRVDYEMLVIESAEVLLPEPSYPLVAADTEIQLSFPSVVRLDGWAFHIALSSSGEASECRLAVPDDAVVSLRTRHEGERFAPLGMGEQTQKLNRWMINRKIPRQLREQIPLLCVNDQPAAILVGAEWTVSEYFAVRNTVTRIIYVRFIREL